MVKNVQIHKNKGCLSIKTSWYRIPFEYEYDKNRLFCNLTCCRITLYLCILFDQFLYREQNLPNNKKSFTAYDYDHIFNKRVEKT